MDNTTKEQLRELVTKGFKQRYGTHPDKQALLRLLSELRRIDVAGYAGYYLMAYMIFKETAFSYGINIWPRGAMASSIVCYSMGLTEVDPLRYGLHSARFVNEEPPKFQFDIEEARFDEFKEKATKLLKDNPDILDYETGCKYLLGDLQSSSYLNGKDVCPLPQPENMDDKIAEYALSFPDTMTLYETYKERKNGATWAPTGIEKLDEILAPTYGLLAYQEQMFDIMKLCFNVHGILANKVRLSIQRGETEQIKAYRIELQENAKQVGLGDNEFDTAWSVLTSNPKAFLKAHAVFRVLSRYFNTIDLFRDINKANAAIRIDMNDINKFLSCNGKIVKLKAEADNLETALRNLFTNTPIDKEEIIKAKRLLLTITIKTDDNLLLTEMDCLRDFIGGFKEHTFDVWGLYKDANQAQNVSLICWAVGV